MSWFLYAQAAAQPQGSPLTMMMPMILVMVGVVYFLQIRPMQKREKEKQDMQAALAKGVEVITAGGICGTVVGITDHHVVVRVDDKVCIKFLRSSIAKIHSTENREE